jgi:hypothetical protein
MVVSQLFERVLGVALDEVRAKGTPVFTFALYHDCESRTVSVCVDTEDNSRRKVLSTNCYNMRHFLNAVAEGDLEAASLWQANIGRCLSLGDFTLVNVARTGQGEIPVDEQFYLSMVRALVKVQSQVALLAPHPERLVLACSSPNNEVGYVWSLPGTA